MGRFLLGRVLATIPVLLVVATVVFALLRLAPGDPAAILAGDVATPEQIAAIRMRLGLDQPAYIQFIDWMGRLLRGDLGTSIISNQPVTRLIGERIEPTLALAGSTILFAVLVAVPLGVLAAWRHGTWVDRAVMAFSVIGFSIPVFVLGYLLILGFAMELRWLPVQGYAPLREGFLPFVTRLVLPTLTLSVIYIALIARITRASVLETLGEDYVRTARAKGLVERLVISKHALRNALIPLVTIIALQIPGLFGGAILTETVFNWPGMGRLYISGLNAGDWPLVMSLLFITAVLTVVSNLLADVMYTFVDPRIRLS